MEENEITSPFVEDATTPDTLTTLKDTLANCTLTATMSGTITALDATVGSVCTGTVATIQNTDAVRRYSRR